MNLHKNARPAFRRRIELVHAVIEENPQFRAPMASSQHRLGNLCNGVCAP